MSKRNTLLLVDDERNVIKSLKRLLIDTDYKILCADSGEDALKHLDENEVQVIISDYRMPGMTGVEFLRKAREKYPDSIRIILSGFADAGAIVDAINDGQIYKFIPKPWNDHDLLTTITTSFGQYWLHAENISLSAELSERNKVLEELTQELESKVQERTRDLEMKNRALMVAQKILSAMPVGVVGVDSEGTIVYSNDSLKEFIDTSKLGLGMPAETVMDPDLYKLMMDSFNANQPECILYNPELNVSVLCAPLPGNVGVIGIFGFLESKLWNEYIKIDASIKEECHVE